MKVLKQLAYLPALSSPYRLDLLHVSTGFIRHRLLVTSYMSSNNYNNVNNIRSNTPGNSFINSNDSNRKYLKVPFDRKEEVKSKGGKWDPEKKMWYMTNNYEEFSQWIVPDQKGASVDSIPVVSASVIPGVNKRKEYNSNLLSPSSPLPPLQMEGANNVFNDVLQQPVSPEGKRFLNVPFQDKDEVKRRGARWDAEAKKWYISQYTPIKDFEDWLLDPIFLDVPYDKKDAVKELGAKWDSVAKKWCILPSVANVAEFVSWMPLELRSKYATSNATPPAIMPMQDNLVMFIDIETSGLPVKSMSYEDDSPMKYDNARAIQLNMITCDRESFNIIDSKSYLIKSDGFPIDNSHIHGITLEKSLTEGLEFDAVMSDFKKYLNNTWLVLAHNADFDINVLKNELKLHKNHDILDLLDRVEIQCTMQLTKPMVGLLNKVGGLKNPSLKELYQKATNKTINPARLDGRQNNVRHLYDAIKQLVDDKKIAL